MGDFKFIHCADIHLGSRFKGVETEDAAEMLRMREAPAKSLGKIIDLALSEKASFIVISGDLFEKTAQPSDRKFFCEEAARAKIPIFISKGNHDVERPWDSAMPYPSNVRVFPTEPESIFLKANSTEVEVVGISFSGKRENRNIVSMLSGTPENSLWHASTAMWKRSAKATPPQYAACRISLGRTSITGRLAMSIGA